MESNGDDVARTRLEIEALNDEKARIEQKISILEARLEETASRATQQQQNDGVGNGSCPPISAIDANLAQVCRRIVFTVTAAIFCFLLLESKVIHTEAYIGRPKVKSAAAACRAINSTLQIVEYKEVLRASNALEILSQYDIVIDATDNAPSRYMISDCCVVLGKPLVSGAALGLEGQLTVYNYKGGPCYRCLFATPPSTTACQRCSDSGVLGVVPGIIGCLQALEAIKIARAVGEPLSGQMLLFDALSARIRIVKIRGGSLQCEACGENPTFNQLLFKDFDYEKLTQSPLSTSPPKLKLLATDSRITAKEYKERIASGEADILVDVRPEHHYRIVSIPKSLNIPLASLEARLPEISSALKEQQQEQEGTGPGANLYVICRRGNNSQRAVQFLHNRGFSLANDIVGGLESWSHEVDPNFPLY